MTTVLFILLLAVIASVICLGFVTIAALLVPWPQVIRGDSARRP